MTNEKVPENIEKAMVAMLDRLTPEARRRLPPSDGSMFTIGSEEMIGNHWLDDGWKLQATLVNDERVWTDGPHLCVHAYSGSVVARTRIDRRVRYTKWDRREHDKVVLTQLRKDRDDINKTITKIEKRLARSA